MCPMCAASVTAWLLVGGTGGAAALTSGFIYLKARQKKAILNAEKPEVVENLPNKNNVSTHYE